MGLANLCFKRYERQKKREEGRKEGKRKSQQAGKEEKEKVQNINYRKKRL